MSAEKMGRRLLDMARAVIPPQLQTTRAQVGLLLLLGLALRAYGYLRNPSVWHDEAALVLNVLGKDFASLLGPLYFSEAAPPLFLWAERAVVLLLGDSTFSLRLLPFLAGCATLLLSVPVARALLRPAAVPWAVLLFAFNDHLLAHASEAKPYSLDVLAAMVLLTLWVRTRGWAVEWQLLLYAALAPIIIFLVYPGCFLLGGLMLALLPALWRERMRPGVWAAYGALALSVGTAFLLLYLGPARAQRDAAIEGCWVAAFPPWGRGWWAVPVWVVRSTLEALCYCCAPAGNVLAGLLVVGALGLWKRGERASVVLLVAPAGLALVASFIGGYPYCGTRVLVFLTPAVVLLIAAGVPPALTWLGARSRTGAVALALLVLAAVGTVAHNTAFPYGRSEIAIASRYVLAERRPGDVVWGNGWEQGYYFRRLGKEFIPEGQVPARVPGRLWLVIIAARPQEREVVLRSMAPAGWEWLQRREYYRTSVLLLQPPGSDGTTASARPGAGDPRE